MLITCVCDDPNEDYKDVEDSFFYNVENFTDLGLAFDETYNEYKGSYININHFMNKFNHLYKLIGDERIEKILEPILRNKKIDDILE